jgi:hypothetical protein
MRKLLPLFIICGLAGCATTPQQAAQQETASVDEALTRAMLQGTSTITGHAFAKTASGEVRYAAGVPINLLPMTPYVATCVKDKAYPNTACGQKLSKFLVATPADGEGRFIILNLKPGTYYLSAAMPWAASTNAAANSGGIFHTEVTIKTDDQTVTADIHP